MLGLTLACASSPTSGGPRDVPVIRTDTTISVPRQPNITPAIPATLGYRSGVFSYDLEQTTVITVGTDSAAILQDTLLTTASLTYSIQHAEDSLRVLGIVDSLSISSARDSAAVRLLAVPVHIELGPVIDSTIILPMDSTTILNSCDSMDEAARTIAEDVHLRIPTNTQPGQRWTDSTVKSVCRGGIPMTAVTVSTFDVQDVQPRSDSLIARVIRRSMLTLSGAGTQGVRRITVTGTGTSETVFSYELRERVFLGSDGESILRLRFETIQQTEQVTQHSVSHVRRRTPGS